MTEEAPVDTRSEIRKELDVWLTRNVELENTIKSKGVGLSPLTFFSSRLNALIDYVIGPIDDTDPESARILWETELAKFVNGFLTTANQEVDSEIRKMQLVQGVGQQSQQLHLPR